MNILILRNVLIFTLLILGQQSFSQSINDANLQKILTENPSILNNIPQQDKTTFDNKLISENQNVANTDNNLQIDLSQACLLYTSPSPRDKRQSRMPSSA